MKIGVKLGRTLKEAERQVKLWEDSDLCDEGRLPPKEYWRDKEELYRLRCLCKRVERMAPRKEVKEHTQEYGMSP